jgi:hypothetical protein
MHSQLMRSLLSPHGVYSPTDVDAALARVFGPGVRPLHLEEAVFEAMLDGWRAQQTARYLKPKTIQHNERGVRAFIDHVGRFPWEWRQRRRRVLRGSAVAAAAAGALDAARLPVAAEGLLRVRVRPTLPVDGDLRARVRPPARPAV